MTMEVEDNLKRWGWTYFQTGPNEGEWLLFGPRGLLARQGDGRWRDDYRDAVCVADAWKPPPDRPYRTRAWYSPVGYSHNFRPCDDPSPSDSYLLVPPPVGRMFDA